MPRKRTTVDEHSTASAPTKRHRVSQACNPCRTAREKCDGTQPNCGPCIEQSRTCTYTSPSKKRGIPTGYIRTVELALAWLFDQIPGSEESLHRLLIQDGTAAQKIVLGKEGKGADRLHKRWRKSKVHREIERLLCNRDGTTPKTESSDPDSDTDYEMTQDGSTISQSVMQPLPNVGYRETFSENALHDPKGFGHRVAKIPPNYCRLLDIYFTYTHCWFPILEREEIMRTALAYPPEGLMINLEDQPDASHAQLWAALALASFQDAASSNSSTETRDMSSSPAYISTIATKLITMDGRQLGPPHIRAMLLMSLAALGQDKANTAWLLVGSATRLAMQLYPGQPLLTNTFNTPEARLIAGCFILDTFISISLGQYPHWRVNLQSLHNMAPQSISEPMPEIWTSISGFGLYQDSTETSTQPITTFLQLYKFSALLANYKAAISGLETTSTSVTSEHLLRSLSPEFAYCNSLIFGGPIPMVPSSFVVQGAFLTASMILVSGRRAASLVPNFLDVAEGCIANFGACGIPPIFLTCMMCLQQNGHLVDMHGHDRPRWDLIDRSIKSVWNKYAPNTTDMSAGRHMVPVGAAAVISQNSMPPLPTVSPQMDGQVHSTYIPQNGPQLGMHAPEGFVPLSLYQQTSLSPSATSPLSCPTPLKTSSMATSNTVENTHQKSLIGQASFMGQSLDYDAILEELGSIDCIDGMDMNSQFMANLGFAPGSDLADMLHGEFGL